MVASKEPEFLINELRNPQISAFSLAKELFQEAQLTGKVQSTSFYNWLSVQKQALKLLTLLALKFPSGITIVEHYSDYFKLKLEKSDDASIGRLFGLVEVCKDTMLISEYSVSQTSMEQIF